MIVVCPACNRAYKSISSKFCSYCGMARPEQIICDQCGSELDPDASYCDNCGARTALGKKVAEALGEG